MLLLIRSVSVEMLLIGSICRGAASRDASVCLLSALLFAVVTRWYLAVCWPTKARQKSSQRVCHLPWPVGLPTPNIYEQPVRELEHIFHTVRISLLTIIDKSQMSFFKGPLNLKFNLPVHHIKLGVARTIAGRSLDDDLAARRAPRQLILKNPGRRSGTRARDGDPWPHSTRS